MPAGYCFCWCVGGLRKEDSAVGDETRYRHRRLGDILVEHGIASADQVKSALERQRKDDRPLGAILVDMGVLREQVARGLAEQRRDIPEVSAKELHSVPPEVVHAVPETLARRFNVLAIRREEDNWLVVAMENARDLAALDLLTHVTGCQIEPVTAPPAEITAAIEQYYGKELNANDAAEQMSLERISLEVDDGAAASESEPATHDLLASAEETPVVRFVEELFKESVRRRASDVHLEPGEQTTCVRLRVDGVLHRLLSIPRRMHPAVVSRIKIISGMNIAERRLPQDGRCRLRLSYGNVDVRVSTLPTLYGEKVVMRLLDKSQVMLELESRGLSEKDLKLFKSTLLSDHGMILLSGPTGSGKTTTLYAGLSFLNDPKRNIVTVEDPVEYELAGVGQVQVKPEIGLTFARALRHILRQDPNIVMIGEMRDLETTQIAIRAALTGHLVLSTLHANSAPGVVSRLLDIGVPPYLITASLKLAVAQRLVRRLCDECKEQYAPDPEEWKPLGCNARLEGRRFHRAKGCDRCDYTGYRGRVGIFELMPIGLRLKQMILKGSTEPDLRAAAREEGMMSLQEQGVEKVVEGVTSVDEILSLPTDDAEEV